MSTVRVSSIATREYVRQALRRHRIAGLVTLAIGVALSVVAIWAIRDEHAGEPWPLAAVAVVAAGVGSTMLGAVLLAALAISTGALGARIGAVSARVDENGREIRALRSGQEADALTQRQLVAELARLRSAMQERDEEALRIALAASVEGYRRGRADVALDPEALRDIYWRAYSDAIGDLGGSSPVGR